MQTVLSHRVISILHNHWVRNGQSRDPRFPPSRFVRPPPLPGFGSPLDNLCGRGSYKPKRLEPLGASGRTHAHCPEAAAVNSERRWPEWQLSRVLLSLGFCNLAGAAPLTAFSSLGLVLSTHSRLATDGHVQQQCKGYCPLSKMQLGAR